MPNKLPFSEFQVGIICRNVLGLEMDASEEDLAMARDQANLGEISAGQYQLAKSLGLPTIISNIEIQYLVTLQAFIAKEREHLEKMIDLFELPETAGWQQVMYAWYEMTQDNKDVHAMAEALRIKYEEVMDAHQKMELGRTADLLRSLENPDD